MQLRRATFVQPNLSFSTKSNYSIVMEGKTWKFLFKNWHLMMINNKLAVFAES